MGSPTSPIVANLYMENLEVKAINTSPHPLWCGRDLWMTLLVVIKAAHKQEFLEHINSIDHHIQFTSEDSRSDGSMPLLDMMITPKEDGRLSTTVYRKPTHIDLYLQWDSHHTISSKYSVVGTLHHRARTVCSNPQLLQQEEDHLSRVLTKCKYPAWAINRVKIKMKTPAQKKSTRNNENKQNNCQKPYIVVPYYQGLSESMKRTCNKHGVQVHFKGGIYKCDRVECDEYIGDSSRTCGERFKEHQMAPSPIYDHYNTTGHKINIENFRIVGKEDWNLMRTIKEAMHIRVNDPSLNRNIGKYHLPHIWDEVLFNTSELKII